MVQPDHVQVRGQVCRPAVLVLQDSEQEVPQMQQLQEQVLLLCRMPNK